MDSPVISQAAAEIIGLINARPATPRQDELEAIIAKAVSGANEETEPADRNCGPVVGSDGEPLEFGYTNVEFANTFCPWIRLAFLTLAYDEERLREFVSKFVSDDPENAEPLLDLLDAWESIEAKFGAIAEFARAAWARTAHTLRAMEARNGQ